jgi:hypothetical protein
VKQQIELLLELVERAAPQSLGGWIKPYTKRSLLVARSLVGSRSNFKDSRANPLTLCTGSTYRLLAISTGGLNSHEHCVLAHSHYSALKLSLDNKELSVSQVSQVSPFRLMIMLFLGLGVSVGYGLLGLALVSYFDDKVEAQRFFVDYTSSFKTIISLGLILGTWLIVFRTQDVISETIEAAFTQKELDATLYFVNKRKFYSLKRSISFSAEFIVVAFILFTYCCQFSLSKWGRGLMIIAMCTQYALGVYVGRKLMYTGMMLHSLLTATVKRNLFRKRELDAINVYVHVASTLTLIFGYIHVRGYFDGQFQYGSMLGESSKVFLLIPVIIATPVLLIFNFYPRAVLRKLYSKSIDVEIGSLKEAMKNDSISEFEKRSYLLEFEKMSRDELRYSLQLTLSDLPIGITILIMALESLLKLKR